MIRLCRPGGFYFDHVNLCVRPLFYAGNRKLESVGKPFSAGGADSQQNP